jgi:hypothetical protein
MGKGVQVSTEVERSEKALVAVKETLENQNPMVLASGNEAVAVIADKLMKLSPGQRAFLRLRFYYETDTACANKIGVQPATVRQWKLRDEGFNLAYQELLTQPLLHARAELLLLTQKAIHRVGELIDSTNPTVALSAAEKVLKGKDAQMLTNNLKVETDDGDLFSALLRRMAGRKTDLRVVPKSEPEPPADVIDADFREVPASQDTTD